MTGRRGSGKKQQKRKDNERQYELKRRRTKIEKLCKVIVAVVGMTNEWRRREEDK